MFPARQIAAAMTASLLLAGACLVSLFPVTAARAQAVAATCEDAAELAVLPSPIVPWKGAPLRVIFVAEKPLDGELSLIAPDGSVAVTSRERRGGPPYFWIAEIAAPAAGKWRATLASSGCNPVTRDIDVRGDQPPRPGSTPGSVWPIRNAWNRETENLYSAWIEKLFDAPLDAPPSWPALHEVLRDKSRNVLYNYLGLGEDQMGMVFKPDCADMPYFLRAYFAFKMGLPFGYSKCSRGTGGGAPKCPQWFNIQNPEPPRASASQQNNAPGIVAGNGPLASAEQPADPAPKQLGLAASFAKYIPVIGDAVHSGSGRTAAADDNTDYYPVALTQDALRPGTIYADPFGHVLMLTKRVPQTADAAGVFLSADAQPDGTVAIKRFWRGNFLYAQDNALGSPGFKRFRPVVRDRSGNLRRLTNAEIAKDPQYANFSLDPSKLSVEGFYDRMDDVASPSPLDPMRAMKEAITALDEQVRARVTSVENGRKFQGSGRGEAAMPDGPAIFETTGAWEDFATPSRDLRLLIAIDVVRGFPDNVARRPERYAMPAGRSVADVKAELQNVLASELASRKFSYIRSDGSPWTLTIKDVVDRAGLLEMAYNVNDCVELRWGAPEKSEEAATCKRYASQAQRAKMMKYRAWFADRRRPPRV
ncbi:MAG: hypothetical protein K2X60_02095 [Xanthobacteraceae bacterium]|nr:hypothetical protein [Xanthobacteraceae bacterium]